MQSLFIIDDIERPGLLHLLSQIDDGTEDVGLGMVDVAGQPGSPRVSACRVEKIRSHNTDLQIIKRERDVRPPAHAVDVVHLELCDARPSRGEGRQLAVDEPPQLVVG